MATKQPASPRDIWVRAERAAKRNSLEALYELQLLSLHKHGLPGPVREYVFHPTRRWRFDFAWPEPWLKIAVELDGGTHEGAARGRHMRSQGFQNDADKLNAAAELGWRVFRYTAMRVRSGYAITEIRVVLERAVRNRREA